METNNRKDRLDRLKLRSDDRDDPYDREDYMETRHKSFLNCRLSSARLLLKPTLHDIFLT